MIKRVEHTDFDEYADDYEGLLQSQLSFFDKDRAYFSDCKIAIAAEHFSTPPHRILDFGCGVGLSLPFFSKYFPHAKLYATDISKKSLAHVLKRFPNVSILPDGSLEKLKFDMIFVSGVFHHLPVELRADTMHRLASLLTNRGALCVFEHNPFNPVTRHLVSTCSFDGDAMLISLGQMTKLLMEGGHLRVLDSGYFLFFPSFLTIARILEKWLRWVPMGGQYFVIASK